MENIKIIKSEFINAEYKKDEKYKQFYMHRIGHWLGMDVHDCGSYIEPTRLPTDFRLTSRVDGNLRGKNTTHAHRIGTGSVDDSGVLIHEQPPSRALGGGYFLPRSCGELGTKKSECSFARAKS